LKEEALKVLKIMNEVTSRTDLNGFARMVGLTPTQTIDQMQELLKTGLIRKVGSGYGITEKGKATLRVFTPVPKEKEFHFYNGVGQPTSFQAESIKGFYELVKRVSMESLEFHLYRGDFENWLKSEIKDAALAEGFAKLRTTQLKGENLRQEINKAIEAKYSVEELS
jgi:DNA-binding Lrp family transcriptional regulator